MFRDLFKDYVVWFIFICLLIWVGSVIGERVREHRTERIGHTAVVEQKKVLPIINCEDGWFLCDEDDMYDYKPRLEIGAAGMCGAVNICEE